MKQSNRIPPQKTTEDLFEELKEGVKIFQKNLTAENYIEFLDFKSKFHTYSYRNMILIRKHCPHGLFLAKFNDWKFKHKLPVRKGEKGIPIFVYTPIQYYIKDKKLYRVSDADPVDRMMLNQGKYKLKKVDYYKIKYIYDISQTVAEEGDIPQILRSQLNAISDRFDTDLFYHITQHISDIANVDLLQIDNLGVTGPKGSCSIDDKVITFNCHNTDLQNLEVVVHESAHALLHSQEQIKTSTKQKEVEAESVAYIVLRHFNYNDFDISAASFNYIKSWAEGAEADLFAESMERICNCSKQLISSIESSYTYDIESESDEREAMQKNLKHEKERFEKARSKALSQNLPQTIHSKNTKPTAAVKQVRPK